jgi:hypothetical protein
MEIAKIVLEYIDVLIWPCVVILALFVFRKQIITILNRLKGADLPGGVSLDFDREMQVAEQLSRKVEATRKAEPRKGKDKPSIPLTEANTRMLNLGLQPSPSGLDLGYYRNLAKEDPNLALAGLRMEIEILAKNLAKGFSVPVEQKEPVSTVLRKLYEGGKITTEQFQLTMKILKLCNAAVHGRKISMEEAEAVIDVERVLADQYLSWLSWGFPDGWRPTSQGESAKTSIT